VLSGKSLITVVSVNGIVARGWLEGRVIVRAAREERERERETVVIERILTGEIVRE
jgi:hypothetical protein